MTVLLGKAIGISLPHGQLNLQNNNIGAAGAAELGKVLAVNRTLTTVCCRWEMTVTAQSWDTARYYVCVNALRHIYLGPPRSSTSTTTELALRALWSLPKHLLSTAH